MRVYTSNNNNQKKDNMAMMEVCNKVNLKFPMSVFVSLRRIPSKVILTLKIKALSLGRAFLHSTRTESTGSFLAR